MAPENVFNYISSNYFKLLNRDISGVNFSGLTVYILLLGPESSRLCQADPTATRGARIGRSKLLYQKRRKSHQPGSVCFVRF